MLIPKGYRQVQTGEVIRKGDLLLDKPSDELGSSSVKDYRPRRLTIGEELEDGYCLTIRKVSKK